MQAVQRTELLRAECTVEETGTLRRRHRREERVHQSTLTRGAQRRSRAVQRKEEIEEGGKVTRSAEERGSGAAETSCGLAPSGNSLAQQ